MSMNTIIIRELYPDFVKRLKASTKDFVEHHFDSRSLSKIDDEQVDAHLLFIKRCYYDDVQELEEIMFFTSSPFYEFNEVYSYVNNFYEALRDPSFDRFWDLFIIMLEKGFSNIDYRDNVFYFNGCSVPKNPYDKNIINIKVFEFVAEVVSFVRSQRCPREDIFSRLVDAEFFYEHDFDACYEYRDYCVK